MIKETVLRNFSSWDTEKQLSEFQSYKAMGDYSPFSLEDYTLMEMIMQNPNIAIECANGVCSLTQENNNDELAIILEASDTNTLSSVFNNLLANKKVKKYIRDNKDKQKLIKLYKLILPQLETKQLKRHLNIIFSKIKNVTSFITWEKTVYSRLSSYIKTLVKIGVIDVIENDEKDDANYIEFNIDSIRSNMMKTYPKLSALLLLDLTSVLTQHDKKIFFEDIIEVLKSDKDIINDKEITDEQIEKDEIDKDISKKDKLKFDVTDDDLENETTSDDNTVSDGDLEDIIKEMDLDSFSADKHEFDFSYKDMGGNLADPTEALNNTGDTGLSYLMSKNPDTPQEQFDELRAANKIYKVYIQEELIDLQQSKIDIEILQQIASTIETHSMEEFDTLITELSSTYNITQITKALKTISKDLNMEIKSTGFDNVLNDFKIAVSDDNADNILDSIKPDIETYNRSLNDIENRIVELNVDIMNPTNAVDINKTLIQKMMKLSEYVGMSYTYDNMAILLNEINDVIPLNKRQFPHPKAIKSIINDVWVFMDNHKTPEVKQLAKLLVTSFKTGEGVGEKFIEFVLPFAFSGKQNSYDIKIAKQAYEIKTYIVDTAAHTINDSIRLGQEGNIFKSESFVRMFTLLLDLQIVFDNTSENFELVNLMLYNAISKSEFDKISLLLNDPRANQKMGGRPSKLSLIEQLRKGEFSKSNINIFHALMKLVSKALTSIVENKFYFMKLYLKDRNIDLAINPIGDTEKKLMLDNKTGEIHFNIVNSYNKKIQKKIKNAVIRILGNREIINNPDYIKNMIIDSMTLINKEFEKHPMILLNDFRKSTSTELCAGVFTNFTFDHITQSGFKILPTGYIKKKGSRK